MPIKKLSKAIKRASRKAEDSLSPVVKITTEAVELAAKKVECVIDDPKGALDSIEESAKNLVEEGKQAASSISKEAKRMASVIPCTTTGHSIKRHSLVHSFQG